MMKKIFISFSIIGVFIILILSFIIPNNPFEMLPKIPESTFDKPVWLCILVIGSLIYLIILWSIYDFINERWYKNGKIK